MNSFRSIDELIQALSREKTLLKEMFAKRKTLSFRLDLAETLVDYKMSRIQYLVDYGVIRDNGNFLELEDVYLKFFEEVLKVNEEINLVILIICNNWNFQFCIICPYHLVVKWNRQ